MRLVLVMLVLISSCSSTTYYQKEHDKFMSELNQRRVAGKPKLYRKYLLQQRSKKEEEIQQLKGQIGYQQGLQHHSETMDKGGIQDVHQFKASSSRMKMDQVQKRINLLEKELFTINSQLHSLDK